MQLPAIWRERLARIIRLRRHLNALFRYATPFRLYNLILIESERILGREVLRGLPYVFVVDPLNTCQLRCPLCITGTGDLPLPSGKMRLAQYRQFIDGIARHTIKLDLYNWGEPFLHRDIVEMISYAHLRRISTAISSNLNALPPGGGEAVVRSGLDDLIVSCDGLTQETYSRYRKRGDLGKLLVNLKEIAEAKHRLRSRTPHIEFQFLVFRHNEHEVPQVNRFAREHGADQVRLMAPFLDLSADEILPSTLPEFIKPIYTGVNALDPEISMFVPNPRQEESVHLHPPPISCYWPWRSLAVNWNGELDPCCFGNFLDSFGNIFDTPLAEIWNGHVYRSARRWIRGKPLEGDALRIVCRGCPGYH